MRQLYDEGREAGIPPEVLRAVATAYLNLATAAVDIKKAVDCAPEKPTLRVVK